MDTVCLRNISINTVHKGDGDDDDDDSNNNNKLFPGLSKFVDEILTQISISECHPWTLLFKGW